MADDRYWCDECQAKIERSGRLLAEILTHCPDPNFIPLLDGQRVHRDSPIAREAWLRRQLEGLGKRST
jgi:hypothetical protein